MEGIVLIWNVLNRNVYLGTYNPERIVFIWNVSVSGTCSIRRIATIDRLETGRLAF